MSEFDTYTIDEATPIIIPRYGLRRIAHTVKKENTLYTGAITFETTVLLLDEREVALDLETLLIVGLLNTFGTSPRLSDISFKWESRLAETPDGTPYNQQFCRVSMTYLASRVNLTTSEKVDRLQSMGYNASLFLTQVNGDSSL